MQYRRDKKGNELSVLGYGCMRFTKNGSSVDLDKAEKEVMAAIKAGVNYFDTAYVYAGNEAAVGEDVYKRQCQYRVFLADLGWREAVFKGSDYAGSFCAGIVPQ